MTSLVNRMTEELAASNSYDELSTTVGLVAAFLLMALLLTKEILRASARSGAAIRVLDVGIAPLLPTTGIVIVARLAQLLT